MVPGREGKLRTVHLGVYGCEFVAPVYPDGPGPHAVLVEFRFQASGFYAPRRLSGALVARARRQGSQWVPCHARCERAEMVEGMAMLLGRERVATDAGFLAARDDIVARAAAWFPALEGFDAAANRPRLWPELLALVPLELD